MPQLIGHRGANMRAPQNTIPAFREAFRQGAAGVEFDVHMCADGNLVVCHNYTIDDTSNGFGNIAEMPLDELKSYDFGSWFSSDYTGTTIPTLEETLDACRDFKVINIEIKRPLTGNMEMVKKTLDTVSLYGLDDKAIVSSFDIGVIDEVRHLGSNIRTGILYSLREYDDKHLLTNPFSVAKEHNADALHPHYLCTRLILNYIEKCHENGLMANIWGLKSQLHLEHYKCTDADLLITDVI